MLITSTVLLATIIFLIMSSWSTDLIFAGAVLVLIIFGVISPAQAFSGFSNEGLLTIAFLYVVAAGLIKSGAALSLSRIILGESSSQPLAQIRMMFSVAFLSAFINNTAVVATFLPSVRDWIKRRAATQSHFLMPLSFAAILGGTCSLYGSSTNVVIAGMLLATHPEEALGIFSIALVGIPATLLGLSYLFIFSRHILPDRGDDSEAFNDPNEYLVEMRVQPGSPIVGKTVEQAGLRHLQGVFLAEIQRDDQIITAVGPRAVLLANDRLIFAGDTEAIVDLRKINGLEHDDSLSFAPHKGRVFVEAVVSAQSNLIGKSVRSSEFRTRYNAAILAISRHGQRLAGRIGDIVIEPADILLLECDNNFLRQYGQSKEFLLASQVENSEIPNFQKSGLAWAILILMVGLATSGLLGFFSAAFLAAGLMIMTRCLSGHDARESIDLVVLLSVGLSFGLGEAVKVSGIADLIIRLLLDMQGISSLALLMVVYLITSILTLLITNTSAAILILPTVLAVAEAAHLPVLPFAMAVMIAASASFAMPTGYQTNLMVYSVGAYKVKDFFFLGLPLQLLVFGISMLIIPRVWPLI